MHNKVIFGILNNFSKYQGYRVVEPERKNFLGNKILLGSWRERISYPLLESEQTGHSGHKNVNFTTERNIFGVPGITDIHILYYNCLSKHVVSSGAPNYTYPLHISFGDHFGKGYLSEISFLFLLSFIPHTRLVFRPFSTPHALQILQPTVFASSFIKESFISF